GVLALRKREIMAERKARAATATETTEATPAADVPEAAAALPAPDPLNSREAIAKAARLSSSQVVMIEKIQKQAAPELVAAVKSGTISINAAAAVATLPAEEQVAAAVAGKDELKQAAKRVRELSKRKPREEAPSEDKAHAEPASSAEGNTDELHALRLRVAELTAENTELRRQVAQLQAALPADSAPF
ncbi:MAG: plasmid replication/partition related protein, partial [Acidovorax sp. 65-7]